MTGSNWTSCDLRSVEVGVVGAAQCGAAMSQPVTQDMICAGGVANQGACVVSASMELVDSGLSVGRHISLSLQFDEGGPLTYIKDGQAILIGDYSWSEGCAVVSFN